MGAGFGMEVTVISTSPKKEKEALKTLKADHFVVSKDEAQMSVRAFLLLCSQLQTHKVLCCDIPRSTTDATQSEERAPYSSIPWRVDGDLRLNVYVCRLLPTLSMELSTQCPPSTTSPSCCPC